jgi:hypothetical protein
MRVRLISLALFGVTLSIPSAIAGNIVVNPSFELGGSGWTINQKLGPTENWSIDFIPHTGDMNIDTGCAGAKCLDPVNGAFFYQDLPTIIGEKYTLSFWAFFDGFDASHPNELKVNWDGNTALDIVNSTDPAEVYKQYSAFDLLATTTSTRLQFFGRQDLNLILGVDDVSVTSNPEPSTFLLVSAALLIAAGCRWRAIGSSRLSHQAVEPQPTRARNRSMTVAVSAVTEPQQY